MHQFFGHFGDQACRCNEFVMDRLAQRLIGRRPLAKRSAGPRMPKGILKGLRTLTTNIVMEMGYSADLHREALIATAVVLFVFILIINFLFSLTKRGKKA